MDRPFSDAWINHELRHLVQWVYDREASREETRLRELFEAGDEGEPVG